MGMSLSLLAASKSVEVAAFDIESIRDTYAEIISAQRECGGAVTYRAKVGTGGSTSFEIITGDEDMDTTVKSFQGVIIHSHKCNALFEGDGNTPPTCSSIDGIQGCIHASGEVRCCEDCPFNEYGTDKNGRGKACKNMQRLYILIEGSPIPLLISLPPTSLKAFQNYRISSLAARKLKPNEVVTEFSLSPQANSDGIKYSVVKFKLIGKLNEADKAVAKKFSDALKPRTDVTAEDYNREPAPEVVDGSNA